MADFALSSTLAALVEAIRRTGQELREARDDLDAAKRAAGLQHGLRMCRLA